MPISRVLGILMVVGCEATPPEQTERSSPPIGLDTPQVDTDAPSASQSAPRGAPSPEEDVPDSAHSHRLAAPEETTTAALRRIRDFHGHAGPYVVLGYRMGLLARRLLESPGYFDMDVAVETPLAPPPSCLIDGIQVSSGCTTGKRNLTVKEGKLGRAVFTTENGRRIAIALSPELPERIRAWIEELGVEEAGRKLLSEPEEGLFLIEKL